MWRRRAGGHINVICVILAAVKTWCLQDCSAIHLSVLRSCMSVEEPYSCCLLRVGRRGAAATASVDDTSGIICYVNYEHSCYLIVCY